jgi:hypothetical protein
VSGDSNSELDCEEIESMLDEGLPDDLKNKKKEYEERFKTVLEGEQIVAFAPKSYSLCFREGKKPFRSAARGLGPGHPQQWHAAVSA